MPRSMLHSIVIVLVLGLAGCTTPTDPTPADEYPPVATQVFTTADQMVWADGPGSLPPGSRFALLEGSPSAQAPLTLRLAFPQDYHIPAHTHPANEHVTVLSGTLYIGNGDVLDQGDASTLPAGAFAVIPEGEPHYAFTQEDPATVQLHSNGPWGITYLDPADDPRA